MDLEDFIEETNEEEPKGERPVYRVMQPQKQRDGNEKLVEVGAMWKNTSKQGNEFYTMKIGALRLLVFPNKLAKPTK